MNVSESEYMNVIHSQVHRLSGAVDGQSAGAVNEWKVISVPPPSECRVREVI